MSQRNHAALKHGGYSATAVLPGESTSDFKKLHQKLIAELTPSGPLEDDVVETIARLLWRKQHLGTLAVAEHAQSSWSAASRPVSPVIDDFPLLGRPKSEEQIQSEWDQAESEMDQVKHGLGQNFRFIEIGEAATFDGLEKELSVKDRLDSLIDRGLKRLLRGLKSISAKPISSRRTISPRKTT